MGKHSVAASREDCHNTLIWVRGNDVVTDYSAMFISGETFEKFMKSLTSVGQALPPEMRKSLFDVQDIYIVKYGFDGAYERMNNRTVAQIFSEFKPVDLKPITSGEVDGVRYRLYDVPPPRTNGSECSDEQL